MCKRKIGSILVFFLSMTVSAVLFAQTNDILKSGIYSKLKCCNCGIKFEECHCAHAGPMRVYIDALLESNTSQEEIYYRVAKKFSLNTILDKNIKQDLEKRLAEEAGPLRPRIVLEITAFNFGEVNKTQGKVKAVFKLVNQGNADLLITNLRASCVCTTISLTVDKHKSPYFDNQGAPKDWKMELKPNQTGELEVVLNLAHKAVKSGDLIREVMITSNDPLYPEVSVKVEAKVIAAQNPLQERNTDSQFSGKLMEGVRVIELKASKYKFEPDPLVVKKGERVRLVAKSLDVAHGIAIPEVKLNLPIPLGRESVGEFTAFKAGEFTAYCSVYCGSGHRKMRGKLMVK